MKNKITITDISQSCGVSPATVSRVLNRNPYVSEANRKLVGETIERLKYQHSEYSKKTIAIIIPHSIPDGGVVRDIYSLMILNALTASLYHAGYRVHILGSQDYPSLNDDFYFGVISLVDWSKLPDGSQKNVVPIVFINRFPEPHDDSFCIRSDEKQGMELAVSYLKNKNHTHIGMLGVGDRIMEQKRAQAFDAAIEKFQLISHCEIVAEEQEFYEQLGKLINTGISALVIPGEEVGMKVAYALQLFQYKIPQDISLIGWNTPQISEYWYPRMTAISQDFIAIAEHTVIVFEKLKQKKTVPFLTEIPYQLIERDSVKTLT